MNLRPVDILTLTYLVLVSALVLLFHTRLSSWFHTVSLFAMGAIAIIGVTTWAKHRPNSRCLALARLCYPLIATGFIYNAVESYVLILHGHYLDERIHSWEVSVLGAQPYLLLSKLVSRPLTEFMMLSYFSYYTYFIVPPLMLFARKRIRDLEKYIFTLMLTLYVCYLGYVLVPMLGPSLYPVQTPHLSGYLVTRLQYAIMASGDPRGSTFPSAHVAGAWTALLCIARLFGTRAFCLVLPCTLSLTISVVYTNFHYIVDVVAGVLVAGLCVTVATRFYWLRYFTVDIYTRAGTRNER